MKGFCQLFFIFTLFFTTFAAGGWEDSELFRIAPDNKIALNKKILSKIRAFDDDFKPLEFKDFESSVNAMFKDSPNEKAMIAKGDYNGDGQSDVAVMVKKVLPNEKFRVVAFLALTKKLHRSQIRDYEVHIIDTWVQGTGKVSQYLSLNQKKHMDFSKTKLTARDLIQLESFGGATVAFFYHKNSSQSLSSQQLIRSPFLHIYKGQFEYKTKN